ncbi:MAG TPA: D-alanyl-D-alanine carboxypeptidase/D-alanyl-D-alanine-endopeptidase [Thermoanaerobaculia bacterium]|nr:D-alanyl-D-alanine carboxypeptidase/D-alanyl-D-alanine-endopeptidase [Thermoanaerobaculia bacterium]
MKSWGWRAVAVALIAVFSFTAGPVHAARKRARTRRAAAPVPKLVASGATLEERLASLLAAPTARSAEASVQVVEIGSGRVVAELTPHQTLAPASNMKLFTTAGAIDLLQPPPFEIRTTVYVRGNVEPSGTLDGDVKIVGHGDPTIGGRFHDGNATAVQQEWATDLQRAGIKTVRGNLIFEYGYMDTDYIQPTWPLDQFVTWYEAPISAFSMQEGCVQVRVLPGRPGRQCTVQLEPPTNFVEVENSCVTGRGLPFVTRQRNTNTVIVRGGVPARSGPTEVFVSVEDPIHYFATVTAETFVRAGLKVEGQIVVTPHDPRGDWRAVSQHTTPLNVVVYVVNKKSQNHYAEQLVKIIGAEKKHAGTWEAGTAAVTEWLTGKLGVPANEFHQVDGSGLSRDNRASANAFIHLLTYMWKSPFRDDFVSSLPYSGDPDAKFGKRLKHAPYARQVYAKTGYIVGVVGLSGYVHAQSGKIYAFSFIFNHYRVGVYAIYNLQDEMLKELITRG